MARKPARKTAAKNLNKAATAESGTKSRPGTTELKNLINQLCVERQHHIDSIAEIDETFRKFGIGGGATPRKGAPSGWCWEVRPRVGAPAILEERGGVEVAPRALAHERARLCAARERARTRGGALARRIARSAQRNRS